MCLFVLVLSHAEYRISVYGRKPVEWDTLAAWVVQNRLYSDNNVWMIQVGAVGVLVNHRQMFLPDRVLLHSFQLVPVFAAEGGALPRPCCAATPVLLHKPPCPADSAAVQCVQGARHHREL